MQTSVLVRHALKGDWDHAAAASRQRGNMLKMLESHSCAGEDTAVNALRQAIAESDQTLDSIQPLPVVRTS